MTGFSSTSTSRATAALRDGVHGPRIRRRRRPVLFLGPIGADAATATDHAWHIVKAVNAAGFRVYVPTVAGLLGNDTSVTRIDDELTYAASEGTIGAPIIIGQSNGAACGLRWARTNQAAAIVAILPPLDAQALVEAGTVEGTDMTAAYTAAGLTSPIPAVNNPIQGAVGDEYGCPIQIHYANDDDISLLTGEDYPDAVTAFADLVDAEVHDVGALGHTAPAVAAVDADAVVAFIRAHT